MGLHSLSYLSPAYLVGACIIVGGVLLPLFLMMQKFRRPLAKHS